jgi:arginase
MVLEKLHPPLRKINKFFQEINPSLSDDTSVKQTVAVGCSLVRAALGKYYALRRNEKLT